jgi:hypothetical protein
VNVFLLSDDRQLFGSAKVVRVQPTGPPWLNYSFALEKPRRDWFLIPE